MATSGDVAAIEKPLLIVTSLPMSKPIFKILEGPSPTKEGISQAATAGLTPLFSAGSKAVDSFPHDSDGLLQALNFKNQVAKAANKRSHWFGGRFYNKFSGEEPGYIPLSGTHLRQALSAAGIEAPDFVVGSGKYLHRLDISEDAVGALLSKTE